MPATKSDPRMSWRQGDGLREMIMDEIRQALRWKFNYIDIEEAEVLVVVSLGMDSWVAAIGHPSDASYEWVGKNEPQHSPVWEFSNLGYGCSSVALRDGLMKMTM